MLSPPSLYEDGPSEFDLPPASDQAPRKSLADFFPPVVDDEDEGYDPFALPPVAAPVSAASPLLPAPLYAQPATCARLRQIREGELGESGRYDDAAEGRTEGYYAGLAEAPDRLRASDLNELLLPGHLDRLRFTNFPLQAYGAIFKWEVLVENSLEAYRGPWVKVAEDNDLPLPGARPATEPVAPASLSLLAPL